MADDDDDDLDLDDDPPRSAIPGILLPAATSLVALAVGAVLGGLIVALIPRQPKVVEVARDLDNTELEALCRPKVEDAVAEAATDLEEAQEKVRTLEARVSTKEAEVAELEAEMARRAEKGRELATELKKAKAELAELETRLQTAIEEKEELQTKLTETEEKLEAQIEETIVAKEDAIAFKWKSFVGEAQLSICEKGGRKKMGRCRETVEAEMSPEVKASFEHCVRADQEIPLVKEAAKGETLPKYGRWIDQGDRVTEGWYILLCDPTLPEAEYWKTVPRVFTGDSSDDLKVFPEPRRPTDDDPFDFEDLDQ